MRRTSTTVAGISLLLGILSTTVFAAGPATGRSKYGISAEKISLDYDGRTVIFSGHPKLATGDFSMTSDVLRITYGTEFREVRCIVATGGVRIEQGSRRATAEQAILDNSAHTIVLTGSPTVSQDGHKMRGTRITVRLSGPAGGNETPESPDWNDMPTEPMLIAQ